jgi:hypothetical protein
MHIAGDFITIKGYRITGAAIVVVGKRRYRVNLKRYNWLRSWLLSYEGGGSWNKASFKATMKYPLKAKEFAQKAYLPWCRPERLAALLKEYASEDDS